MTIDKHFTFTFLKTILILGLFILQIACDRQTDSSNKSKVENSDSLNTIISKYYGSATDEMLLFNDKGVKCTLSQVIDGSSCAADIFLYFNPQQNILTKIENVTGQMKWQQNGQIIPSPFLLSHISTTLFNNDDKIADTSFTSPKFITEKFKTLSNLSNSLIYNIEFSDSTYKNIPSNVEKVILDLQIEIITNGKKTQYKRSVYLDAIIHNNIIPSGRND